MVSYLSLIALLFLLSLLVNLSLLLVFVKKESLRTTSNRFVINLLVVNLTSSCVLLPLVALDTVAPLLASQCLLSVTFSHSVASLSLLATLTIGWDQYLAVLRPLRYHHHMTGSRSSVLITGVWTVSCLAALEALLLPVPSPLWSCCPLPSAPASSLLPSLLTLLLTTLLPALTLVVFYCHIYSEAHTSSERNRSSSFAPASSENMFSIAHCVAGPLGVSQAQLLGACRLPRHRSSSASHFLQHWEEGRAALVCLVSLGALLLCWGPLATTSTLHSLALLLALPPLALPPWAPPSVLLLSLLYSLLSPLIFALRHQKIRLEVMVMLHLASPRAFYLEQEDRLRRPSTKEPEQQTLLGREGVTAPSRSSTSPQL